MWIKGQVICAQKRPTRQRLLSTMRRTLQMAWQTTQTHEEMQTLWQVHGYEKGLEIQKTIQKRAKWQCQETGIIACSNGKGVMQKLLYIFFVTLPAVMGKASCRNFAIFCWNLPAVMGRVPWRKLLFMVVTLPTVTEKVSCRNFYIFCFNLPAVMGKASWRYLWKCDNNLFLELYFLLHLKHFMALYCFKQLFLLKCKIFYATAVCFCGIVSFLLW